MSAASGGVVDVPQPDAEPLPGDHADNDSVVAHADLDEDVMRQWPNRSLFNFAEVAELTAECTALHDALSASEKKEAEACETQMKLLAGALKTKDQYRLEEATNKALSATLHACQLELAEESKIVQARDRTGKQEARANAKLKEELQCKAQELREVRANGLHELRDLREQQAKLEAQERNRQERNSERRTARFTQTDLVQEGHMTDVAVQCTCLHNEFVHLHCFLVITLFSCMDIIVVVATLRELVLLSCHRTMLRTLARGVSYGKHSVKLRWARSTWSC